MRTCFRTTFFQNGQVSGLIDFYFACTDFLAYDLAICLNAWCFRDEKTFEPSFAAAIMQGYESVRPLSDAEKPRYRPCVRALRSAFC